ncbi:MAG: tRNA preQ1(34) S-adenosylmethionine ribosyltransferase-isomerase QueA [Candidatus Omnitrophota bacterium]
MRLSDFDYFLPESLIAQHPSSCRDEARLLVVDRQKGAIFHDIFRNVGDYLLSPSLVVVNNTRVIPARLIGRREFSGGEVEVFLLRHLEGRCFEAMLKPLKKIRDGERLLFAGGVAARLVNRAARIVEFDRDDVVGEMEKIGHIPLPPYIKRPDDLTDRVNYQTVYARCSGSVAAPTAGLHFTRPLMNTLKSAGHDFAELTLHVNYGTFKPVETEDISRHPMHAEEYVISAESVQSCLEARSVGRRVVAVGTTSCRTLETFARTGKTSGWTDIFMYPGAQFKMTDSLITNFHLPRSTLLMLVAAFGGLELIRRAYEEAVREKYRFYSYGDAMIIL